MLWFRRHVLRRRMSADGRSERGATIVEYGLIVALFAMGMFGVVRALQSSMTANYSASESRVGAPQSQLAAPSLPSYDPNKCPAGQWPNPLTGACDTSQKDTCKAASQGWDSGSNSCVACTASQWFNATTVACDVSLESTCASSGTAWNSSTNTCEACPLAQPWDPVSGTCKATAANCPVTSPFDSASGSCVATSASCTAAGRWLNTATGVCDVKATCVGDQTFNSSNNTCTQPTCTAPNVLNPTAGTCTAGAAYCPTVNQFYVSGNACSYGATCTGTRVWSSSTSTCASSPTPTKTSGSADNDNGTQTFDVFSGSIYASAPYVVSLNITQCSGVTGVSCSSSGSIISVTPGSTTATGTVTIKYTFTITWPTGASATDSSNASTSKTLTISMTN